MKKVMSLLLTVLLILSSVSVGFAVETTSKVLSDIRFDFISDTENVLNTDPAVVDTLKAENGELIAAITKKDFSTSAFQIHFELPGTDLGDGGYYMYVKAKYQLPDGVQFDKRLCGWRSSLDQVWPGNSPATSGGWNGYQIMKYDISTLTGTQYLRLYFALKKASSSVTGVAEIDVDWVVLSKNPTLDETTAVITELNDGVNNITLEQDGNITELIESNASMRLSSGVIDGLPEGFTAVTASGVSDVTYQTKVSKIDNLTLVDITATGIINGTRVTRSYRISMPNGGVKFNFDSGDEGVITSGDSGAISSIDNGQFVLSVEQSGDLSCKKIGVKLPELDFGTGGYYMHIKAKYELSANVAMGSHFVSGDETYALSAEPWSNYKINTYDITEVTGLRSLNWLIQFTDSSNGTASLNIDYIILSNNSVWTDETPEENINVNPDIRFDFISDTENVLNTDSVVVDTLKAENGSLIAAITKKDFSTTNYQIQFELPQVDLGDGGYYMYVKAKYDIPEGVGFQQVFYGSRASLDTMWPATGGNQHITWDGYKILKFDISELTEQQYIRLYFWLKKASSSITGVAAVDVDWVVLSKNSTLDETTAVITTLNDGTNNIVLEQDGDITDAIVTSDVFTALTTDSMVGIPDCFTVETASGISDITYYTKISDSNGCKILDITAIGTKDSVVVSRSYRINIIEKPEADIRFDFISDTENVLNTDSAVVDTLKAENGSLIAAITKKDFSTTNYQIQFELPQVDLGDGGYYMYVKAKYDIPEGVGFQQVFYGSRASLDTMWPATGGNQHITWDGYKILKFDISELTEQQYIRLYFWLKKASSSITGVAAVDVDWVVLSKNSTLDETTAVITTLNDGTNNIALEQDGDATEAIVSSDVFTALESGSMAGVPNGFTVKTVSGINSVTYYTTVTKTRAHAIMDINVKGKNVAGVLNRSYRVVLMTLPGPDIRFDFISDTENVLNTDSAVVDTLKSENGSLIAAITKKDFSTGAHQIQFELPQVDLGDGGYYMYVKAKYDIPEDVGFQQVFYGSRTSLSTMWPATGGNQHITWDGYKVLRFDISELTGQQYIRLYFWLKKASSSVTGVAEVDVDWIVLTESSELKAGKVLKFDTDIINSNGIWTGIAKGELEHSSDTQNATMYFAGYDVYGSLVNVEVAEMDVIGSADNSTSTFATASKTLTDNRITNVKLFIWDDEFTPLIIADVK